MSKSPVRLAKKKTVSERIDECALNYAHIIFPVAVIVLLFLFIALCFAMVGVSATESGVQYNQFKNIV